MTIRSNAFSWAVYLACSWTWCIGMFLPVLLVRDYGIWGWVVFAVPNVIGAAAMGWVIRSPDESRQIVQRHQTACLAFSIVTISFQFFFAVVVLPAFLPIHPALKFFGILAVFASVGWIINKRELMGSFIIFAFSALAFIVLLIAGPSLRIEHGVRPMADLAPLSLVCVFGFAFCPYLDLTFHHARQQTDRPHFSFGVGFGILFLLMIIFTLVYAPWLLDDYKPRLVVVFVGLHMLIQLGFTVGAHSLINREKANVIYLFAVVLGLGVLLFSNWIFPRYSLSIAEAGYRIFMAFYGLVFPAYVWICMIGRRSWKNFALAIVLAAPMYWIGFIEGKMFWLLPGLAVVLLAKLPGQAGEHYPRQGSNL